MVNPTLKVILVLVAPAAIILGAGWAMGKFVDRDYVKGQLQKNASDERDRRFLNQRFCGYNAREVGLHWGALNDDARKIELRFLELDLVYPLLYGAAILGAALIAWTALGRPFQPIWLALPVAITLVADWVENLVQLHQLNRYMANQGLQEGWIHVASVATVVKLLFFVGSLLMVAWLAGWMICRVINPPAS